MIYLAVAEGLVIIGLIVALIVKKSPDGFQDEHGYHSYQDAYEELKFVVDGYRNLKNNMRGDL